MIVKHLFFDGFMNYQQPTNVTLPENGIMVIQGTNGAGKTTILEAVSVGLFGKTLRGSSPWREGEAGFIKVETNIGTTFRTRGAKGKLELVWETPIQSTTDYGSAAKAQEALESVVGGQDVWRRTSVFSSQDAAHFTQATDGERKRLLESLLRLERFDKAYDACKVELRAAEAKSITVKHSIEIANSKLESLQRELQSVETELAAHGKQQNVEALYKDVAACTSALSSMHGDLVTMREALQSLQDAATKSTVEVEHKERACKQFDAGNCPTCSQPTKVLAQKLRSELELLKETAQTARSEFAARVQDLRADMTELDNEYTALLTRRSRLQGELKVAEALAGTHARLGKARGNVLLSIENLNTMFSGYLLEETLVRKHYAELEACSRVLGLRGVRATVLGKALKGIEATANVWLSRIAGAGTKLHLKSWSEKKTGGTSDAISLEITGIGGGADYKARSGGERRRIDIALIFALAEVSAAIENRGPSTLFIDEAFDTLDAQGIETVSAALADLAQDRPIVLITHSDELAATIKAVKRLRVENGVVSTI